MEIRTVAAQFLSPGNICFEFLVLVLRSGVYLSKKNSGTAPSVNLSHNSRARDRVFAWTCNTEGALCALKENAHRRLRLRRNLLLKGNGNETDFLFFINRFGKGP